MRIQLVLLVAFALLSVAMARSHHQKRSHHSDEDHHSKEDHHDSDSSSSSSSSSESDESDDHHDSDENHHSKHHESDKSHHGGHHDSDESHHSKHHDSDESHHDSDKSHHGHHKRRHDSDESHHDSDESHHGNHRRHKRHHDSDESHHSRHHDSDESHHSRHHDSDEDDHHDDDDVYYLHVGDGFGPYEYIDENDGRLKGFDVDLVNAVCAKAHKTCYIVHDNDETCWHTRGAHQLPGPGLLDGWYDGCVGLSPTPERLNSFNFTSSHSPNVKAGLFFRTGEVPEKNDLHGKKVGFVSGWAMSRSCLSRQDSWDGNTEPDYNATIYETHDDMVAGLKNKDVDAILSIESVDFSKQGITAAAPWFYCTLAGQSVMTQYGSDLIPWWNRALDSLINKGDYKRLCNKAKDLHSSHGTIQCLD